MKIYLVAGEKHSSKCPSKAFSMKINAKNYRDACKFWDTNNSFHIKEYFIEDLFAGASSDLTIEIGTVEDED